MVIVTAARIAIGTILTAGAVWTPMWIRTVMRMRIFARDIRVTTTAVREEIPAEGRSMAPVTVRAHVPGTDQTAMVGGSAMPMSTRTVMRMRITVPDTEVGTPAVRKMIPAGIRSMESVTVDPVACGIGGTAGAALIQTWIRTATLTRITVPGTEVITPVVGEMIPVGGRSTKSATAAPSVSGIGGIAGAAWTPTWIRTATLTRISVPAMLVGPTSAVATMIPAGGRSMESVIAGPVAHGTGAIAGSGQATPMGVWISVPTTRAPTIAVDRTILATGLQTVSAIVARSACGTGRIATLAEMLCLWRGADREAAVGLVRGATCRKAGRRTQVGVRSTDVSLAGTGHRR